MGHHLNHVQFWSQQWSRSPIVARREKPEEFPIDFSDAITKFYISCFADEETDFISNALRYDQNNVHIIIYHKYRDTNKRDGNETTPRHELFYIAAAATIRIAATSTTLLYLGTSRSNYNPEEDFYTKINNNAKEEEKQNIVKEDETAKWPFFSGKGFGSFLLSASQYLSVCVRGHFNIIAQVHNNMDKGAIYFYLHNYFVIIPSNH